MTRNKTVKRSRPANEGVSGRIGYFMHRAWSNIRQNLVLNLLTTGTIFLSILLFSFFFLVYVNVERAADRWSRKIQVAVYFDHEIDLREMARLKKEIQGIPGTAAITYVSRGEAMERFRTRLRGQESLLDGISTEVLPSSLEITLSGETRSGDRLDRYISSLRRVSGIGEIQYGEEWIRKFHSFLIILRMAGLILGAFLALTVLFIVSNTIKLTIYSRRDELELMELVGATPLFIKIPFLIEGVLQGAAGGTLSLAALFGIFQVFIRNPDFHALVPSGAAFLSPLHLVAMVAGGIFAGLAGSLAALQRFMPKAP